MRYFLFVIVFSTINLRAQTTINTAEWFLNDDPGFGQATPFSNFSPGSEITLNQAVDLNSLQEGIHLWSMRVRNNKGVWSQTMSRAFRVLPKSPSIQIANLEWFWGQDPGFGRGTILPINRLDSLKQEVVLNLGGLREGIHYLSIRIQDEQGTWSPTLQRSILIRSSEGARINRLNYRYIDPSGVSFNFSYTLDTPQHFVDLSFDPEAGDFENGVTYQLCISAQRTDNMQSFEQCQSFQWIGMINSTSSFHPLPMNVYPNPNSGVFQVNFPPLSEPQSTLNLIDATGTIIWKEKRDMSNATNWQINQTSLPQGAYFVVLEAGHRVYLKKILIQ